MHIFYFTARRKTNKLSYYLHFHLNSPLCFSPPIIQTMLDGCPGAAFELKHIKDNKPALYNMLVNSGFSVRRSGGNFFRVGIDMALEQTINAKG